MVTEELLQFIREQRAAGMEQAAIDRFLVTEGGWDAADIAEALRVLDAPSPTPFVSSTPSFAPSTPAPVLHQEPSTSLDAPQTFSASSVQRSGEEKPQASMESPHVLPTFMATSSAALVDQEKDTARKDESKFGGLRDILSGTPHEQMLAQPPITHENFLGLFAKGAAPSGANEAAAKSAEPAPTIEAPQTTVAAAPPTPEVVVPPPAPVTPPSQPIKFNLSALRANVPPPSAASQRVTIPVMSASGPGRAPATSGVSLSALAGGANVQSGGGVSPQSIGVAKADTKAPSETNGQEVEKKIPITGKRTMASDMSSSGTASNQAFTVSSLSQSTATTKQAPAPASSHIPVSGAQSSLANVLPKSVERQNVASAEPLTGAPPKVTSLGASPFQDDELHKKKIRRIFGIALGAFVVVLLLAGGAFAFVKFRSPDPKLLLSTAFTQFFAVTSLSYAGQITTDLALSATSGGMVENGTMKFLLKYDGKLANTKDGYGDGSHTIALAGGWHWDDSLLSTDMRSDIRSVGNALYFHVLALPDKNDLDPTWFKNNWLKVDIADLATQLRISGVAPGSEEYGSFGGTSSETAFNMLFVKSFPLVASGGASQETVDGVSLTRIHVVAEPASMAELVRALYRKYTNRTLALSEDQLLRFKGALAKISGDVWVNTQTGALAKIMLAANFDDDIAGVRAIGPVSMELTFPDFNKEVSVTAPVGALTLADLNLQMSEFKQLKEVRARDQGKIDRVALLTTALEDYQREKGRYPKALSDLYGAGKLATSSVGVLSLNSYHYRSYQQSPLSSGAGTLAKSAQCLTTGKLCPFYHLGVNFEDVTNPALSRDADQTTAILGADTAGCSGEAKLACYDVVGDISPSTAPAAATSTVR